MLESTLKKCRRWTDPVGGVVLLEDMQYISTFSAKDTDTVDTEQNKPKRKAKAITNGATAKKTKAIANEGSEASQQQDGPREKTLTPTQFKAIAKMVATYQKQSDKLEKCMRAFFLTVRTHPFSNTSRTTLYGSSK